MLKNTLSKLFIKELIFCSIAVLFFHVMALEYYLYWNIDWFDIFMHFLGGATMGFLALYSFFTSGYIPKIVEQKNNLVIVFCLVILFTLVVGLTWELWELFVGFSDILEDKGDAILDLIMDTLGAIAVFFYAKNKLKIK